VPTLLHHERTRGDNAAPQLRRFLAAGVRERAFRDRSGVVEFGACVAIHCRDPSVDHVRKREVAASAMLTRRINATRVLAR